MIFGLSYIPQHGVYRLHDAFDHFLNSGCDQTAFGAACFPDWFGSVFRGCPKLRKLSEELWKAFKTSDQDLSRVRTIWKRLIDVETLCNDCTHSLDFDQPSSAVTTAIRNLFDYLYDECLRAECCKMACGDIDTHYAQFRKESATVCPFCGLESYPDFGCGYRAAYDHFLCRRSYPLLSVCFRNLVPICDSCNKAPQKGDKDMLRSEKGLRRKTYYPFGNVGGVNISVKWAEKRSLGNPGRCELSIGPKVPAESEKVKTWITVYRIPERAAARIQSSFDAWLKALLRHRGFATKPTVAQLREFFRGEAQALTEDTTLRRETDALYKHGLCAYLADVAGDAELEGIAYLATSGAVFTPVAVG
jgi:hypothetical protein